jgi:DNA polymerase-3 subunit epsilon/ATP-dependent DNA helicase DinG
MEEIYLSLDLETTGLKPESDEIIEIAAVKFRGDEVVDTFHTLVNPGCSLPYRVTLLTGITEVETGAAPLFFQVAEGLTFFLGPHPIVGHNIAFDLRFLSAKGIELSNLTYDTLDLARILLPGLGDYSLTAVARQLGFTPFSPHRALSDATMAKGVFSALLDRAAELAPPVIAELVRLTAATPWPLRPLFLDIEKAKGRDGSHPGGGELVRADVAGGGGGSLIPEAIKKPLDTGELTSLLERGSPLERSFPGFEYRSQQVMMMQAVAQALNDDHHLIVEAGAGVGKSMAYLLPSIFFALRNKARVVISTDTISLQEQLMNKDIPQLLQALDLSGQLQVALLKGRGNYLCLRRWNSLRQSQILSPEEFRLLLRTIVWLSSTESGDRAEIHLLGSDNSVWNKVSALEEHCPASQCDYYGDCFLYRARSRAEGAHLVVVNHALLLSDSASERKVLPDYRHLIIDEAHNLEEEATHQLGFQMAQRALFDFLDRLSRRLGGEVYSGILSEISHSTGASRLAPSRRKDIKQLLEVLQEQVEGAWSRTSRFLESLAHLVKSHFEDQGEYERRLRLTVNIRSQPAWRGVELAWEDILLALKGIDDALGWLHEALKGSVEAGVPNYDHLVAEVDSLLYDSYQLQQQVNAIVVSPQRGNVYWISLSGQNEAVSLHASPLEVGQILERSLFSRKDGVVLASATLSTEGSLEYLKGRLGLREARELSIGTPFNYLTSTMIYTPQDIPEPGKGGYQQGVEKSLVELCCATRGRTLVLFTSYAALRATYAAIQAPLEKEGLLILGQGIDGAPKQLLATFRSSPMCVLLGTSSFWEGVDVVGEALSVLVIVRLPFSVPTDPIFAARSEMFPDAFNQYALPQAILRFKQGFGRLIRSKQDRGVVVVLDRRLETKYYGAAFLNSLPLCTVRWGSSRDMAREVRWWLEG